MKPYPFLLLIFLLSACDTKPTYDTPLDEILGEAGGMVNQVLEEAEKYEVQILYTQIDRDSLNQPYFTPFSYRLNKDTYFYPASTVKMPAAFMALEKVNQLRADSGWVELDAFMPMFTDSAYSGQSPMYADSTAESGLPSVAHYIKKIFLVSDNDAFNRLYEFIGQSMLNTGLHNKGFTDLRLVHRLSIFLSPDENRHTNPVYFGHSIEQPLYRQEMQVNETGFNRPERILKGKGELLDGKIVAGPKDFATKNYISLQTLNELLKTVLFPTIVPDSQRFLLTGEDYRMLYQYMSELPTESTWPTYPYEDSFAKFLMYGDSKDPIPEHIRIFNKIGMAYGYLTDVAYVVDFEANVEFMLAATISVNENQIFNDGEYEYEEIGLPFLAQLGKAVYAYELQRTREYEPDLGRFRMEYE